MAENMEELQKAIASENVESVSLDARREAENSEAKIELDALKDYYELRTQWASFIKWMIFLLIVTQIICIVAIGNGLLSYKGNETLTWIFFSETFAQVIGLAILVVKFLFNHSKK